MSDTEAPAERQPERGRARRDDPERTFAWYEPKRRRATLYEDVTVDTQPSIHRHVTRGWPVSFEDGRGTWDDRSTALKATDWYDEEPSPTVGVCHTLLRGRGEVGAYGIPPLPFAP